MITRLILFSQIVDGVFLWSNMEKRRRRWRGGDVWGRESSKEEEGLSVKCIFSLGLGHIEKKRHNDSDNHLNS